jgi:hypothetical protein
MKTDYIDYRGELKTTYSHKCDGYEAEVVSSTEGLIKHWAILNSDKSDDMIACVPGIPVKEQAVNIAEQLLVVATTKEQN